MNPEPIVPNLRAPSEAADTPLSAATAGPGRVIRQARERARLGIEELASQTRLSRATLEALERDDFTQLNEAVYVRGYYRKCAKVLNLPEAELIAAYDREYAPKQAPMATKMLIGHSGSTMGPTADSGSSTSWLMIIVIASLLGAAAFLVTREGPIAVTVSGTEAPVTAGDAIPATALLAEPTTPANESAPPAANGPSLAVAGSLGATPGALPPDVAAVPGVALAPATALSDPNPEPSVPAAAELAPAAAGGPAANAADALVLDFRSASWVRIEDADGRTLLSGTIQAGDRQVLAGKPPYSLFIGYAPGVTVQFAGKPVDLTPHVRQNSTARLNLPYGAGPAP